jgi:hypothetical protein
MGCTSCTVWPANGQGKQQVALAVAVHPGQARDAAIEGLALVETHEGRTFDAAKEGLALEETHEGRAFDAGMEGLALEKNARTRVASDDPAARVV